MHLPGVCVCARTWMHACVNLQKLSSCKLGQQQILKYLEYLFGIVVFR